MAGEYCVPVRVNPVLSHQHERRQAVDPWRFRLDPEDRGIGEKWHLHPEAIRDHIDVPGCWQGQGFGGDGTDHVWDFRLDARTFRATYQGTGWYAATFRGPAADDDGRTHLLFGGVHPSAEVWLNGEYLGAHRQPFVPFGFDVTGTLRPGSDNDVVVRVSEAARELGLAFSWQGNWSGLYRHVELYSTGAARINSARLYPDAHTGQIRCVFTIDGNIPAGAEVHVSVSPLPSGPASHAHASAEAATLIDILMTDPVLWSPDHPNLYRVDAVLVCGSDVLDALSERTGFVALSIEGKHFCINGEPYYMRGTGEFIAAPETGSPDTDRDRLRRKLSQLRAYGYNYVRFQSYVQAPEYYDVADEVGLLLQSEMGVLGGWGGHTQWHGYAWPAPTPAKRALLHEQWNNTVLRDVNHPSANIYCMSNELGRNCLFPRTAWKCADETKRIKPTAFVIWTNGGWNADLPGEFVNDDARVDAECEKPVIQHEFRWWSSFPDVSIEDRYDGTMRPYAQVMAREAAKQHGIEHTLEEGAANSQRLQFIEAKTKMEACRRDNTKLAGICHFNAMDASPSPQGIIDEFFMPKYASAELWQETNGDTVVLSGLGFADRVLVPGCSFQIDLHVSDFSHPPLETPVVRWRVASGDIVFGSGELQYAHTPYVTAPCGRISVRIPEDAPVPMRASLEAEVTDGARVFRNTWQLWIIPDDCDLGPDVIRVGSGSHTWLGSYDIPAVEDSSRIPANTRVVVSETLDSGIEQFVRQGGRLILAAGEGLVRPWPSKLGAGEGHYFFTPPANYPPYEDGHDGTIIQDHPALRDMLHERFADFPFFNLIATAAPLDLEPLGLNDLDPVIRVMHSYPVGRSLGYLVERSLGNGGIVICALNLDRSHPEGRLLFTRLCSYAATSDQFGPQITDATLRAIAAGSQLDTTPVPEKTDTYTGSHS